MSVTSKIESGSSPPELYSEMPVEVAVNHCTVSIDQGMDLDSEFNLADLTDVEYRLLEQIIDSQMEAQSEQQGPGDARFNSDCPVTSPSAIHTAYSVETPSPGMGQSYTQSSDSHYPSISSDQQSDIQKIEMMLMRDPVNSPVQTPTTCGEVPKTVLTKVRKVTEKSEQRMRSKSRREIRPRPAAQVRVEERVTCIPRQQESGNGQPTAPNSVLVKLDHPTAIFGVAAQLEPSNCQDLGRGKWTVLSPVDFPCPVLYGVDMCNSTVGISQLQGIGSISRVQQAATHQQLVTPRNSSFSYRQDAGPEKSALRKEKKQAVEQLVWSQMEEEGLQKNRPSVKHGRGRRQRRFPKLSALDSIQNIVMGNNLETTQKPEEVGENSPRERHNLKQRYRRRRIRVCCDELNKMVPFCNPTTDKATVLQWTAAFLKYVMEVCGDSLILEFQNTFCGATGKRIKPSQAVDRATVSAPCIVPADHQ